MNILLFGSTGMLGYELAQTFKAMKNVNLTEVTRSQIRILDDDQIQIDDIKIFLTNILFSNKITHIVNCLAYTDTKKVETDQSARAEAFKLNVIFPRVLAEFCEDHNLALVHISTDYVFSEHSRNDKYDLECPMTTYGDHKLLAELYIKNIMKSKNYMILRVGWIYGTNRRKSFIHKFLKNCVEAIKRHNGPYSGIPCEVPVVDNQISTPTSCNFVANTINDIFSMYMFSRYRKSSVAPSGEASRADFAEEILNNIRVFDDRFDNVVVKRYNDERVEPKRTTLSKFDKMNFVRCQEKLISWKTDLKRFMRGNKDEILAYIEELFK